MKHCDCDEKFNEFNRTELSAQIHLVQLKVDQTQQMRFYFIYIVA